MYYVVELKHRAVIGDSRGARVWDVSEQRSKDRAFALQQANPDMQFAVVPMCNSGNSMLRTLPVGVRDPLLVRV